MMARIDDIPPVETPLHHAARLGDEINVKQFLDDWSQLDEHGKTPAEVALAHGEKWCHDIIFNFAIQKEYARYYVPFKPSKIKDQDSNNMDRATNDNQEYLSSKVRYLNPRPHIRDDFAMVSAGSGVMMEWERPIMEKSASLLFEGMGKGKSCLNVGFGLGIIDTYFESYSPAQHTIIEAHPDCLAFLQKNGWYNKPNVRILEGRWQDFIGPERTSDVVMGKFDVVYFDTFAEGYRTNLAFFKHIPSLLVGPGSRASFFHGLGRHQNFLYAVYTEVIRKHFNDLGMNTAWSDILIDSKTMWFSHDTADCLFVDTQPYHIPICMLAPTIPETKVSESGWVLPV